MQKDQTHSENIRFRVLVVPGGTEIGLEIQRALSCCKEVALFSAGADVSNHAPYVFQHHFDLPSIHDSAWLTRLNQIIAQARIEYILPAHDDLLVALVQHAAAIPAYIVTSPLETCTLTRSKKQTYQCFADILPTPRIYAHPSDVDVFPVFLKPDRGQGAQHTTLVHNREELDVVWRQRTDWLILEYLPGSEYTIDCFADRERGLLFCRGRRRLRVRSGIAMASRPEHQPIFTEYAQRIMARLALHGAWFFQLKQAADEQFTLLEIAPRIAGTMALHRVYGVNFALLSLYEHARIPVQVLSNDLEITIDRALTNRYQHNLKFNYVYVDLDDTLIIRGAINTVLVRFLYQCINQQKYLILLTKHRGDLHQTLQHYRLRELFDTIIQLPPDAEKATMIQHKDAIFIDDSFRERQHVHTQLGIPTFDCSMVEMLLDERG